MSRSKKNKANADELWEQAFVDEAGMNWPFNPTCEPECEGDTDVPAPDAVEGEENNLIDPRWAGLEKFL